MGLAAPCRILGPEGFEMGRGVSPPRALYFVCRSTDSEKEFNMAKQPAKKFRLGLITATIWDNDGFYSVDMLSTAE